MINWPIEVNKNKYSRWYEQLIKKAQERILPKDTYTEGHHIIPKSWGGIDKKINIVRLLAREHYIAHALLWKMNVPRPYHIKMTHAFNAMSIMKDGSYNKPGYRINSRLFEIVKLERSAYLKTLKGPLSPSWGKKMNVSEKGKLARKKAQEEFWKDAERVAIRNENLRIAQQTPESIAKRKASADARRGVKRDPAIIEKMAATKRGKTWEELYTPEQIDRMKSAAKNKQYTPEGKAKQIETARKNGQKPKSEDHKRKISESNKKHDRFWTRGENNPNFGKKWSEEKKQAMRETKLGSKLTAEQLEKQRAGQLAASKTCEYCRKFTTSSNYSRWHGPKCKLFRVGNTS